METEYRVGTLGADDAGAPHRRERIWILAYANNYGHASSKGCGGSSGSKQGTGRAEKQNGIGEPSGSYTQSEVSADISSQHPIGQLADPNVFGCLHGQAEVGPAKGGVHAQREPEPSGEDVSDANSDGLQRSIYEGSDGEFVWDRQVRAIEEHRTHGQHEIHGEGWWSTEPRVGGMVDELASELDIHGAIAGEVFPRVATGIPKRVDRLKAIGNGQVPAAVVLAWNTLYSRIQQRS